MVTIIKDIEVYAPESLGKKDVVFLFDKIEGLYDKINEINPLIECEVIDGSDYIMFPGLIDSHVHISGGGGEAGFKSRTPEISITDLITSGITTVVGCLGTDNICRNMNNLLAKAYGLEEEGISTYVYTGSYEIPVKTITGDIKKDLMLIPKVIGVGEIALSDYRSSKPSFEEFIKIIHEAKVGGILSNKMGIVHIHIGDSNEGLKYLFDICVNKDINLSQIIPTHVNRNRKLLDSAIEYGKKGGYFDLTSSYVKGIEEEENLRISKIIPEILSKGVDISHITCSSDSQGSLPIVDGNGNFVGIGIGKPNSLYNEIRELLNNSKISKSHIISLVTKNVADILGLKHKGEIKKHKDADVILVDKQDFEIKYVFSKGKKMVYNGKLLVNKTFIKE